MEEGEETDSLFAIESLRLDLWHHTESSALLPLSGVLLEVLEDRRYSLNDAIKLTNETLAMW